VILFKVRPDKIYALLLLRAAVERRTMVVLMQNQTSEVNGLLRTFGEQTIRPAV
jgi:hypothetical protein